jgi:hypothetical protein
MYLDIYMKIFDLPAGLFLFQNLIGFHQLRVISKILEYDNFRKGPQFSNIPYRS